MSTLSDFLSLKNNKRKQAELFRKLQVSQGLVDFYSNDYLGLAHSEKLYTIIQSKAAALPYKLNGATGSRLLSGNHSYTEQLEKKLATFFNSEAALLFNSGYAANQAVLSAIPQKNDTIFYDELAHACIKDGARLSLATRHSFKHNNLEDLESKIRRSKSERIFIAVESIYSMDGDECPLEELVKISEKYNASIVLDEAHSTGVVGNAGNGMAASLRLESKIDIRIHTFGKALGVHGACVVGTQDLMEYLVNYARPFIYTTALPPHSLVSIDCALDYLKASVDLQSALVSKINLFLKHANFLNRIESKSAIQTAIFPGHDTVKHAAHTLHQSGLDVRPILSPTVPKNSERLRICLHVFNSDKQIEDLTHILNQL